MILVSGSKFLRSKRFSSIFPSKSLDLDGDSEALVPVAPIILSETAEDFTKGPIPFCKGVLPEQWTKERKPWFCLWFCSSTILTYCFPFILKYFLIPADSGPHYWKKETKPPDACYFVDTLVYSTVKFQFFVLKKEEPPGPSHSSKLPAERLWLPFF